MKGNLESTLGLYNECIATVEAEIKQIKSRTVTDSQLEEFGSYTVGERFEDLVKGLVLPVPPFSGKDAVKDDDLSSVASSATAPSRRSRRGGNATNINDDDDAESVDTRSTPVLLKPADVRRQVVGGLLSGEARILERTIRLVRR